VQRLEESTLMDHIGGENIYSMQSRDIRRVLTMPSRNRVRPPATVIEMPSCSEQDSRVVALRTGAEELISRLEMRPSARSGFGELTASVRMTLVALFALLGWPHSTRDNDPGPSAARPCRWVRTSLISRLWLTATPTKTAAAAVEQFPAKGAADRSLLRSA